MYLAYMAAVIADGHRSDIIRADQAVRDATARCAPQADILRLLDVSIERELDAAESAADFRAAAAQAGSPGPFALMPSSKSASRQKLRQPSGCGIVIFQCES